MARRGDKLCRGCGAKLTLLNRALELRGYCGRCAASIEEPSEAEELPLDADPEAIAGSRLGPDALRLTMITLMATGFCFIAAELAWALSEDNSMVGASNSLKASGVFSLGGLLLGKVIFLRKGNALTFQRWHVFWWRFVGAYFLAYVPLVFLLPRQESIPPRAVGTVAFAGSCLFAYAVSMLTVLRYDRSLRRALCERTPIPPSVLTQAEEGRLADAYRTLEGTAQRCGGFVDADSQKAKLHLALGLKQLSAGQEEDAVAEFAKATELGTSSEYVRLRIARGLTDAGHHAEALEMLVALHNEAKDRDLAKEARKVNKWIKKSFRLLIRCPKCANALTGTTDMVGDTAMCPKCKTEFVVPADGKT